MGANKKIVYSLSKYLVFNGVPNKSKCLTFRKSFELP